MYAKALVRCLLSFFALCGGSLGAQLRDGEQEWDAIMGKLIQANRFWNFLGYSFLAGMAMLRDVRSCLSLSLEITSSAFFNGFLRLRRTCRPGP